MRPESWPVRIILLAILLLANSSLFAEEQSVRPGVNRYYQDPDFATWVERFEREGREVFDHREAIVKALDIKPGMWVADVGAGTGLFSKAFSQVVGNNGKVYAIDISAGFIKNILQISKELKLNNLVPILNTPKTIGLRKDVVDMVFTCDTYHHFEYPNTMLQSIRRSLKKEGQLVVIDYRKQPGISSDWVMNHVRANKQTVIREVEANGFKLQREHNLLTENYFLVFVKK